MQYAFILGNTPKLSVAEIISSVKNSTIKKQTEQVAIVETAVELDCQKLIIKLGGTVKIAALTPSLPLATSIKDNAKYKFGFSFHSLDPSIKPSYLFNLKQTYRKKGLEFKKKLRQEGKRAELIESKDIALSSVIISKEKCLDILILVDQDKKETYAKTLAVQPFREFSHRDYDRPNKDMRSGMLPPKVARMMVNIAAGDSADALLDPFCGSGTILQEAILLGYKKVYGTDISQRAITDTQANLEYLHLNNFELYKLDACHLTSRFKINSIKTVVAEVFLGPPNFPESEIDKIVCQLTALYEKTFKEIKRILKPEAKLVIAFPAWRLKNKIIHLPIKKVLLKLGYNIKNQPILYGRPDARVLREIYILDISPTGMKPGAKRIIK